MGLPKKRLQRQDAETLYEAVNQLIRVHQFRDRDRICCHDVSVAQCYALETLVKQGPLRLQTLAQEMFLDKSTASRVVDSLERKGYVTRVEDASDRRAVQLQPTPAGRTLYQTIRADLVTEELAMIKDMDPAVLDASLDLLRQLTRAAQARCGVAGGHAIESEPQGVSGFFLDRQLLVPINTGSTVLPPREKRYLKCAKTTFPLQSSERALSG